MKTGCLPLALVWVLLDFVNALQVNVIVDDADPQIAYTGNNWTSVDNCEECGARLDVSRVQGGSYHMAHQRDSKAEFRFTGMSISVYGVTRHRWRGIPSNVTFTIDGTERIMETTNTTGDSDLQYNKTLFRADNLSNIPHTLSIQTHDNSLFVLDYLIYATNASAVTAVSNGAGSLQSAPGSSSAFPYDQSTSPSTGTPSAVVGGVIGGIFGAFLLAGIIALCLIKRANRRKEGSSKGTSNKKRHKRSPIDRKDLPPGEGRGKPNRVDSDSSFGWTLDRSNLSGKKGGGGKREEKQRAAIPGEYALSGPNSAHVPVPSSTTTRNLEALSEAANNGGGRYVSAISTFTSSSGAEDGKEHVVHALTTDSPQQAYRMPLRGASRWPSAKRPNTADAATPVYGASQWQSARRPNTAGAARPFSTSGSTLEVDGVLERVMLSHSNVPGRSPREEEPPRMFFSDHPFRTMGSG